MELAPRVDGPELVARYKANYGLDHISLEQALEHFALERRLTDELLASTSDDRHETFERCYDTLYAGLPWLAGTGGEESVGRWLPLIGDAPKKIYEVGSGNGNFARNLARCGHVVDATDISRHRGDREEESTGVRWSATDGVNLDRFAPDAPYDVVVSDQVVEHLHPDDIAAHTRSCAAILRPGGRYIVRTPHAATGPHDMSVVFGFDQPVGMHLHEYTVRELTGALRAGGFSTVRSVVSLPSIGRRAPVTLASRIHLLTQIATEEVLGRVPAAGRQRLRRVLRGPLRPEVWLVAGR